MSSNLQLLANVAVDANLHLLADVAVDAMYNERLPERKEKTIITCGEENQKKTWFDHVPRKVRSARRCTRPNFEIPTGISSSSSSLPCEEENQKNTLFDHVPRKVRSAQRFEIPTGISSSSSSSPCEKENQKKTWFDHVLRKRRSALRCAGPNFENLTGFSSSSSMEKKNPRNPNSPSSCSSENRGHKRRALSQGRRNGGSKKAKETAKEMPSWLVQMMKDTNVVNPKLILKKTLSQSDVEPSQNRFLIPFNSLIKNDFLTSVDRGILEEEINNPTTIGVAAIVIDPMSVRWHMILKMWEMNYSLTCGKTCGWNDIVKANNLKKGDNIDVWSFRRRGILCFALVHSDDY